MTVPVVKRRRDWFWVLRTLMASGVSMSEVARECGRQPTTVQAWSEGSEPKESDARIVLALLAKHNPQAYVEHQRQYSMRLLIAGLTKPGETRGLDFVDVGD